MSKEVEFCNRDRFIELGLVIASLRKMQGLSQEKLAEKAKISRKLFIFGLAIIGSFPFAPKKIGCSNLMFKPAALGYDLYVRV